MNKNVELHLDKASCNNRLNALLNHFTVSIQQFEAEQLSQPLSKQPNTGKIYLIQEGNVTVKQADGSYTEINEASLLMYPSPVIHQFIPTSSTVTLLSAELCFEGGDYNPIRQSLPKYLHLPFNQIEDIDTILSLIFSEAENFYCGRQQIVDGLLQILFIQILRHLMETTIISSGLLAGLAHPKLRHALIYMHEFPAHDFTIDEMSKICCMSRSMFAQTFLKVVGCTPGAYLQTWRINLVKKGLVAGTSLKFLVEEVGYASEVSLSRAFKQVCGLSPRLWLQHQKTAIQ